jgi:hypothetical protein
VHLGVDVQPGATASPDDASIAEQGPRADVVLLPEEGASALRARPALRTETCAGTTLRLVEADGSTVALTQVRVTVHRTSGASFSTDQASHWC